MKQLIGMFLFLFMGTVYSQKPTVLPEREYLILREKARALLNTDTDSCLIYANRIQLSGNVLHQAFAYGIKSYLYQLKGDAANANIHYKRAFSCLEKAPPSTEKKRVNSYLLNFGGLIDWKNKKYNNALDKFMAGKDISEALGDQMQMVKFSNNLGLIYSEIGNFKGAIRMSKKSDHIVDKIQNQYLGENYLITKSNNYLRLGLYYEQYYKANTVVPKLLDSALYYYRKSMLYSKNSINNSVKCQIQIGNILYMQQNIAKAEKMYLNVLNLAKENYLNNDYYTVLNNLGDLYFYKKENQKALACFKKVDSIYLNTQNASPNEYINSNFYQAKIYSQSGNQEKASQCAKTYLDTYESKQTAISNEALAINSKLSDAAIKSEMLLIQDKYRHEKTWYWIIGLLVAIAFLALAGLFVVNNKKKKRAEQKIAQMIEQYKTVDIEKGIAVSPVADVLMDDNKKNNLNISQEKENEILAKLKALEEKKYYLSAEFTQQSLAKKIKTNTTYLSWVVNKYYGRSFSDYSNELRINYAINEMINNPVYRKYSTQAIAESVGFKNAISFTKSFNKRTGVTPAQFIKGLDKIS